VWWVYARTGVGPFGGGVHLNKPTSFNLVQGDWLHVCLVDLIAYHSGSLEISEVG
jgi:hypothetical protein